MLEPRRADVLLWFLFLVVLPVVVYVLLGKWSDASKRKRRINLLVEQASVRSSPEAMVSDNVVPIFPPVTPALRECARCGAPASTRCSRCKSVRYCSGKCQIIHWRQGHKDDCHPFNSMNSSLRPDVIEEAGLQNDFSHERSYPQFNAHTTEQPMNPRSPSAGVVSVADSATVNGSWSSMTETRVSEKRVMRKSTREMLDSKDMMATVSNVGKRSTTNLSKETCDGPINPANDISDDYIHRSVVSNACIDGWGPLHQSYGIGNQNNSAPNMIGPSDGSSYIEDQQKKSSSEMMSTNLIIGSKVRRNSECVIKDKSAKPMSRAAREQINSAKARKGHGFDEPAGGTSNSFPHGGNGTSSGLMKVMGLKKSSKISRRDMPEMGTGGHQKVKVLFPYEEFTRFFEQDFFNLTPRGLLNCGNSCYANAVLQCLTCTKPLITYLLSRTHSRACSVKDWCLLCELEQHVSMLKEAGGPLSPSRILSHIRRINCQIGDGSQEDAHEFLRLLVASMQSICLEEAGGESQIHPSSQETTFVQQTFGGRLRSLVICLRCHHESERYENIMDLTLEIFGWVESLEDALTQFTTPEDLDGENMYRCGRCASYVRARKQLSIDEAPNILTIVLKRFQEGSYGKINKCITFPEMLDMIPFMTGTNDIPPLYVLYGVVVHVDTLNASFSGHYVSYVKDLRGNWFRIDDSVVQPVHVSQVMSEGAYILFYRRSYPRAPRDFYMRKATRKQPTNPSRQSVLKAQKSSHLGRTIQRSNNRFTPHADVIGMEYADVTSSDWSLFTSSDDASFTSESTRDSFSTTDYPDPCKVDPFCSNFGPSQRTISCRMFSGSQQVTGYIAEQQGYIFDSANPINRFNEGFQSDDDGYRNIVNYESSPSDSFIRTFSNCRV